MINQSKFMLPLSSVHKSLDQSLVHTHSLRLRMPKSYTDTLRPSFRKGASSSHLGKKDDSSSSFPKKGVGADNDKQSE